MILLFAGNISSFLVTSSQPIAYLRLTPRLLLSRLMALPRLSPYLGNCQATSIAIAQAQPLTRLWSCYVIGYWPRSTRAFLTLTYPHRLLATFSLSLLLVSLRLQPTVDNISSLMNMRSPLSGNSSFLTDSHLH